MASRSPEGSINIFLYFLGGEMFEKVVLDNGVRIVCEKIPHVRSVSIGIWIGTGSRNENHKNNGISHFIEHMFFKGTRKRNARQIAESIDNIGGQLNAFTGKECTCYYAKTLDEYIDVAIETLSDMFFESRLANDDIEVEKRVILEEISMYEDSPEELVHDLLSEAVWDGNPLGYPILGTIESLGNIDRYEINDYISKNYTPQNTVIAVAGNYDIDELCALARKYFGGWNLEKKQVQNYIKAEFTQNIKLKEKDTEQVHICMGFDGIEHGNDDIYTLLAINNIFGGGMSSHLFQKIREEKGLVYSIYSYPSSYRSEGLFTIYAGMNPEHLDRVVNLIAEEINNLLKKGITREELERSKEQLKGNYILGLESTISRMNSIGKSELLLGYINPPEKILRKIGNISYDSISELIKRVFNINNMSFSVVGNIKSSVSTTIQNLS
jgi:predicted Zn-dependent peptidase